MKSKFSLSSKECCYSYISKDLKKAIEKHKKELQTEENKKHGRKANAVTFSFASKSFAKTKRSKKWF